MRCYISHKSPAPSVCQLKQTRKPIFNQQTMSEKKNWRSNFTHPRNQCNIDIKDMSPDENNRVFKFPDDHKRPTTIYITPDVSKIIMFGGSVLPNGVNKPLYAIYDMVTDQIIENILPNTNTSIWVGVYLDWWSGYFDPENITKFICCQEPSIVKPNNIYHIDTNTGQYTKRKGDHDEMQNLISADAERFSSRVKGINGYHIRLFYDDDLHGLHTKKRSIFKGDKWIKTVNSLCGEEYFMGKNMNYSDYILFLSGYIRHVLLREGIVFPQDLMKYIYDYENRQKTYFIMTGPAGINIYKL